MFRIVSIVLNGDSPVGTETKVRIQFVPSPDVARLTPMSRGAEPGCEGLSDDLAKTMAAETFGAERSPTTQSRTGSRTGSPTNSACRSADRWRSRTCKPSNRWNRSAGGKYLRASAHAQIHHLRPSKDISRDRTFGGRNGCAEDPARHFRRPRGSTAHRTRAQDTSRGDPEAQPGLVRFERREWPRRPDRTGCRGGERHESPRALRIRSARGLHWSRSVRGRGRGHRPETRRHRVPRELRLGRRRDETHRPPRRSDPRGDRRTGEGT